MFLKLLKKIITCYPNRIFLSQKFFGWYIHVDKKIKILTIWALKSSISVTWINDRRPLEKEFEGATSVILWWNSAPFVLLDIFKMAGLAPASEEVHSFTVLWSGAYPQWRSYAIELLRLKIPETWRHVGFCLFMFRWGCKNRGSMDLVHILMDPVHGPGTWRGPMDQGSMFCTFPGCIACGSVVGQLIRGQCFDKTFSQFFTHALVCW